MTLPPAGRRITSAAGLVLTLVLGAAMLFLLDGKLLWPGGSLTRSSFIPPGRERAVVSALAPLAARKYEGHAVRDIAVDRNVIRVKLDAEVFETRRIDICLAGTCTPAAHDLAAREGALEVFARAGRRTAKSAASEPELRLLVHELASASLEKLWVVAAPPVPRRADTDVPPGLIGPASMLLGVEPLRTVLGSWVLGTLVLAITALLRRREARLPAGEDSTESRRASGPGGDPRDDARGASESGPRRAFPRARAAAVLVLLLLGAAVRVREASTNPFDTDERWASVNGAPLFDATHDAWVHPPLFRVLSLAWMRLSGWADGGAVLGLRAPSLLFGLLTLGFFAWWSEPWTSWRRIAALAMVVVAGGPIEASALARPYALAGLLLVLAIVSAFPADGRLAPSGLLVLGVAVSLLAWTDLVAGIAGLVLLGARVALDVRGGRVNASHVTLLLGCAVFTAALAPGAASAWLHQVTPAGPLGPDLAPHEAFAVHLGRVLVAFAPRPAPLLGLAILGCALVVGWRLGDRALTAAAGVVALALVMMLGHLALRNRNAAFLPWMAAAAAASGAARRPA